LAEKSADISNALTSMRDIIHCAPDSIQLAALDLLLATLRTYTTVTEELLEENKKRLTEGTKKQTEQNSNDKK